MRALTLVKERQLEVLDIPATCGTAGWRGADCACAPSR
jgi:hypothetical protein